MTSRKDVEYYRHVPAETCGFGYRPHNDKGGRSAAIEVLIDSIYMSFI